MNYRACEYKLDILPLKIRRTNSGLDECVNTYTLKFELLAKSQKEIMDHGDKSTYMSVSFAVKKPSFAFIRNPNGSLPLKSS